MAEIKIDKELIDSLKTLKTNKNDLYNNLGQLYIERKKILEEFDEKEKKLLYHHSFLKEMENDIYNKLIVKYGEGNINLETGIFTPSI